jgi:hypothetical protein
MASKGGISVMVIPATKQRVLRRLARLNEKVAKDLPLIVDRIGKAIQLDARQNVPVDFGFLRASIYFDHKGRVNFKKTGIREGTQTRQVEIPFRNTETNRGGLTAFVGSDMDYALKNEFENKAYLFPAYEKHSARFITAIDNMLAKAVKQ